MRGKRSRSEKYFKKEYASKIESYKTFIFVTTTKRTLFV
jgi:hypothetical protein